MKASLQGHVEVVTMLLRHNARVDLQNMVTAGLSISLSLNIYYFPLRISLFNLRYFMKQFFVWQDEQTALTLAYHSGHGAVVDALLRHSSQA